MIPLNTSEGPFRFIRSIPGENDELSWCEGVQKVQSSLTDVLNVKNLSFLLGAGCSSLKIEEKEVGIPTMNALAKEFANAQPEDDQEMFPSAAEHVELKEKLGIDLDQPEFTSNLERLMEVLLSNQFALKNNTLPDADSKLQIVNSVITKIQRFLYSKCTQGEFSRGDDHIINNYQDFYRKLTLRDRTLPRPWVFTTNYDLFNESAMDRLGIPYANGFSGVYERRFNPAVFRYVLAEQMDIANRKWTAIDGFVYFCKLHGSISWTEDDRGIFRIREGSTGTDESTRILIYPTPAKQAFTLGSPYSDLFREFQSRIVREQSVLLTVGYSFSDEHINNIIYQALTIPTFRLIIFADPSSKGEIEKLLLLRDPRIWVIGSEKCSIDQKAHYFNTIVDHFMPTQPRNEIDEAINKIVRTSRNEDNCSE